MAFHVMDQWIANIKAHPERGVAKNKPADAVDRCFATDGSPLAKGNDVWDGILDDGPNGACTQRFPIHSTSRIVRAARRGSVFKCQLQSVAGTSARGLRRVAADGRRGRAPAGDLPDRRLRLLQAGRGPAAELRRGDDDD